MASRPLSYPTPRVLRRLIRELADSEPLISTPLRHHKNGRCEWDTAVMVALIDVAKRCKALEAELVSILSKGSDDRYS